MRSYRNLGFLGLAFLALTTYTVTSRALDRPRARPAARVVAPARVNVTETPFVPPDRAVLEAREARGVEVGKARSDVRFTSLSPSANGIELEATALLANGIRDRHFVWQLTVSEARENRILHFRRYDEQLGLSAKGTLTRPTFKESINLLPGEYYITLAILQVPANGVEQLKDLKVVNAMSLGQIRTKVVVP